MVHQQKCVQQETAYSAVVVNVSPSLPIKFFHVSMTPFWVKNYIGTYDHSLQLHYRQFLVAHVFADVPSLSPFDFYTCSTNFSRLRANLERQGAPNMLIHDS